MNPTLIAKIRPLKKEQTYSIGTGYPIAPDLLITARHVIFPHWADTQQIELEWLADDLKHHAKVETIVFDGESCEKVDIAVDIAIVRFQPPLPLLRSAFCSIARTSPNLDRRWDGFGFPRLGKCENDGCRELVSAFGEFHHPNSSSAYIGLSSKSDAIEKSNWAGLSGAPVIQDNKLYAVISSTPTNRDEYFKAVYLPYLIDKYPTFREAIGLTVQYEQWQLFRLGQKKAIECLIIRSFDEVFLVGIRKKLTCLEYEKEATQCCQNLMRAFEQDALTVLDALLQVSRDVLRAKPNGSVVEDIRVLFCLLASLLASHSVAARTAYIRLSVYTRMAAELHTAPLYGTNPEFMLDEQLGELKGKYAIDVSNFVRETGWGVDGFKQEAFEVLHTEIFKATPIKRPKVVNSLEARKLNRVLKQRQNRSANQLYRFELNTADEESFRLNPLSDPQMCVALTGSDWLPDLPIVHYGAAEAQLEAELSAIMDDLFIILEESRA